LGKNNKHFSVQRNDWLGKIQPVGSCNHTGNLHFDITSTIQKDQISTLGKHAKIVVLLIQFFTCFVPVSPVF
jgi:hypothetical protein